MRRLWPEAAVFGTGAVLVLAVVRWGVPWLAGFGIDRFGAWMLLAIAFVFLPLLGLGALLLSREPQRAAGRLRLQAPGRRAWAWAALGALVIAAASPALAALARALGWSIDPFDRTPQPWAPWVFALWALYWPINIFGEELVWRGVMLPRMEQVLGARAWAANAALWALFHVGFGPGNVLVVAPTLLIVPWLAQKTRSTWVAVSLHAFVSLPGMVMIATGRV